MGQGQTKRQIVGSLDMSSSLRRTKEVNQNTLLFKHFIAKVTAPITRLTFKCNMSTGPGQIIVVFAEQIEARTQTQDWAVLRPAPSSVCCRSPQSRSF